MEKKFYFGIYGPYSLQDDGWPNAGVVMRDFREMLGMSAASLGVLYGEATQSHHLPISARRIQQMEANNDVPTDIDRRRVLAQLLNIPPYLFGLASLVDMAIQPDTPDSVLPPKASSLDLAEYRSFLAFSWGLHYTTSADPLLRKIQVRIENLTAFAHEASGAQAMQARELLCVYHYLVIDIARDQRAYETAFNHINSVVELAQDMQRNDILATALLRQGLTNCEKQLFGAASFNITQALTLLDDRTPILKGYVLQTAGLVLSETARTEQERNTALNRLDEAYRIIQRGDLSEDGSYIKLDEGWYYHLRAKSLVAQNKPKDADAMISLAESRIGPEQARRHIYIEINQAFTYLKLGYHPVAVSTAMHILDVAEDIHSKHAVMRVEEIYGQIQQGPYAQNSEVAELRLQLNRIKARLAV